LKIETPSLPMLQLTDIGADFASFSPDGQTLIWGVGDRIYRRQVDTLDFSDEEDDSKDDKSADTDGDKEDAIAEDDEHNLAKTIDVYLPRYQVQGKLALVGAKVYTMDEVGILEEATVLVDKDRITAVGPTADVVVPVDAHVIDLQGRFLVPGYVDTHAHYRVEKEVPEASNASFLANLAYGVTTGIDVQPSSIDILAAQDMVDAGLMIGPRAFSTGPGIFNSNEFKSLAHTRGVLTRYKERYGVDNLKAYISGSRKQRHWLIQAARELKLMPTTEGALDMKLDLTHAVDGFSGLEHAYPTPKLYGDVIQLSGLTRIAYTPTLLVTYGGPSGENQFFTTESPFRDPKLRRFTPFHTLAQSTLRRTWFHPDEYITGTVADSARKVVEAGGQVGVGAHGQLQGLGYHWELWALASGNYAHLEALRAATIMGAEMIGLDTDVGSIKVGKLADFVVLTADPGEDIRNSVKIETVIKGGEVYDGDSLDRIWPNPQPLPDQPWWRTAPDAQLPPQ
ncbi:MAG: amidohydrolase family protein, partial [Pseudomonadota bacterium]